MTWNDVRYKLPYTLSPSHRISIYERILSSDPGFFAETSPPKGTLGLVSSERRRPIFRSDDVSKKVACEACNATAWLTQHRYEGLLILHVERSWNANDTEIEKASKRVRGARCALWWSKLEGGSLLVSRGRIDQDFSLEDGEKGFEKMWITVGMDPHMV